MQPRVLGRNFLDRPIAVSVTVRATSLRLVLISSNRGDFAPESRALFYGAPFNAVLAALTAWSLTVARRWYSVAVILSRSAFLVMIRSRQANHWTAHYPEG